MQLQTSVFNLKRWCYIDCLLLSFAKCMFGFTLRMVESQWVTTILPEATRCSFNKTTCHRGYHRWSEHTVNNHFLLYYYFLDAICQTHPVVRSPFSLPFILTKWVCLQMILLKFWKKLDLYGFLVEKMLMFVLWIEDLEIGIMCTGFRSGWK